MRQLGLLFAHFLLDPLALGNLVAQIGGAPFDPDFQLPLLRAGTFDQRIIGLRKHANFLGHWRIGLGHRNHGARLLIALGGVGDALDRRHQPARQPPTCNTGEQGGDDDDQNLPG